MTAIAHEDGGRTLVLERRIDAPRAAVWRCWTEPELLRQWYCPRPWTVAAVDLDLRPGGRMAVAMQGPDGERIEVDGCFLEVVPATRLVFTDSFTAGYLPTGASFMTGFVELHDAGDGATRMRWGARHGTTEAVQQHLEMGFEQGWSQAATQLDALARSLDASGPQRPFSAKARTCLFLKDQAEAAADFYVSLLADSTIDDVYRPDPDGPPLVVEFTLAGAPLMALNGNPDVAPSHLMSISILTDDQDETDKLWGALCADGGEPGRCGWLKDRFGVHWQIVPKALPRLMHSGEAEAAARVSAALMTMSKIDVAALEAAFTNGERQR